MEPYEKIFIIYKSDGFVDFVAHKSFQSAVNAVTETLTQENYDQRLMDAIKMMKTLPLRWRKTSHTRMSRAVC